MRGTSRHPPARPSRKRISSEDKAARPGVLYLVLRAETGGDDPKPHCLGAFPKEEAYEKALEDIVETVSARAWQLVEDVERLCAWDLMHEHGFEWNVEPLASHKKGET